MSDNKFNRAVDAIREVFLDMSVDVEDIKAALQSLLIEIETMLDRL